MGILHSIIYCPYCGPVMRQERNSVEMRGLDPQYLVTPENVHYLIQHGLEVECMDCGKKFVKHYDAERLRELAQEP